jgi:hypothetical protein
MHGFILHDANVDPVKVQNDVTLLTKSSWQMAWLQLE